MNLYYQKIFFLSSVISVYLVITLFYVIIPNNYCNNYDILSFYINDDTLYCMISRYSIVFYYLFICFILVLTFISSLYIKSIKTNNPLYTITTIKNSNVLIFIPVYSESKNEIEKTIYSVVNDNYPTKNKIMYIVVDGIKKGKNNDDFTSNYVKQLFKINKNLSTDINSELYIGKFNEIPFIIFIKCNNKGKKDSFLHVIKTLYESQNQNIDDNIVLESSILNIYLNKVDYILMLDTDTSIDKSGLTHLVDYLDSNPFTLAVCGETSITNKFDSILTMSQYYEYFITHYALKSFEMVYGKSILVLSGCFALYRKNILLNDLIIKEYTIEKDSNLYYANISKFGEDRLLTNLILQHYPDFNTIYLEIAKCYTNAPIDFKTLLSQRRRWSNSLIFCHLMLLKNLPKYSFFKKIFFSIVLILELWISLFMPIILLIAYYYTIQTIYYFSLNYNQNLIIFIECILFVFLPSIMCIFLGNLYMILYSLPFIITLPIYGIIIPIYSVYYSDDVTWGASRLIES